MQTITAQQLEIKPSLRKKLEKSLKTLKSKLLKRSNSEVKSNVTKKGKPKKKGPTHKKKVNFAEKKKLWFKKHPQFAKTLKVITKFLKVLLIITITLIVILAIIAYLYVLPLFTIKNHVDIIQNETKALLTEAEEKDLSHLQSRTVSIQNSLRTINGELERYDIIKKIPVARDYYPNFVIFRELIGTGNELLSITVPEIIKTGDQLGYSTEQADTKVIDLRSNPTNTESLNNEEVETPDDPGIEELIQVLPTLSESYKTLKSPIADLIKLIESVDPEYIPTAEAKNAYQTVTSMTAAYTALSAQIEPTLEYLPGLLGGNGQITYLVVLQNEKEIRSSGGLLTAYTVVQIENGEVINELDAVDMWELEFHVPADRIPYKNEYGQLYLMNIGCGAPHLRVQDCGVSPDIYVSMDMFKDYYDIAHERFPNKFPAYDHIISLNTFLASDLVSLVEPIVLEDGTEVTSENLTRTIFAEANTFQRELRGITSREDRKIIIGDIGTIGAEKFMELDSEQLPDLIGIIHNNIVAKNLAFYSTEEKMLEYFDSLDLTGRLREFDGDFFHLSEAQICSLKANFFVYDTVTQNITIEKNGTISRDITVEWTNEKIINIYEAGMLSTAPSYRYKAWMRVMAPPDTEFTSSDGLIKSYKEYRPVTYYDEDLDKEVSDNVIIFDPRRFSESQTPPSHTLNVSYTLPESLNFDENKGYSMLLQKHPGKKDERYIINLTYDEQEYDLDFRLVRDMVVRFDGKSLTIENFPSVIDEYVGWME